MSSESVFCRAYRRWQLQEALTHVTIILSNLLLREPQDDGTEIPFAEPKAQETPVRTTQDDAFDSFETGEWRLPPAAASTGALSESLDRIRDLATAVVKGHQEAKGNSCISSFSLIWQPRARGAMARFPCRITTSVDDLDVVKPCTYFQYSVSTFLQRPNRSWNPERWK